MTSGNDNNNRFLVRDIQANGLTKQGYVDVRSTGASEPDNNSLWEYWGLVRRGKYWLLGFTILGLLVGFAEVMSSDPLYRATTTVELENFNESFMGMSSVDPLAGSGNYTVNQFNINTQLRIIESVAVRAPVGERLLFETTPVLPPVKTSWDRIRERVRRRRRDPMKEMHSALSTAAWSLKAKSITGTRILSISCESTVPEIAADLVNAIAQEYINQSNQRRFSAAQKTSQWLESQLEEIRVKLVESQGKLEAFSRQAGGIFANEPEGLNTLANAKLHQLTANLAASQEERITRETKFNAVNDMVKKGVIDQIPEIADNAALRILGTQLADAQKRYKDNLRKFTPANPIMAGIQEEIDNIQAQIKKEQDNILQRISNEYQQSLERYNNLAKAYGNQVATVTGEQGQGATYSLLKREVDIYQQTLNSMLGQVNTASVVAAVPANNIQVLDTAFPPSAAFTPIPMQSLGFGGCFGLAAGIALLLVKEMLAKRKSVLKFCMPGYSPSLLAVPELGVIPTTDFRNGDGGGNRARRRWPWKKLPPGSRTVSNGDRLAEWGGGPSRLVESFRLTMASLMLMFRNSPRVLVVTSPGPGEGKSTISTHLAMAMAEAGKRVLLIDMDLRRPQLHTFFNLPNERGFADLVRGSDMPLRITGVEPPILPTAHPRVSLLTSGHIEVNDIGELFHSPRVPGLLRQLRDCFDVVVLDTPPLLEFSESRLAASFSDGVLLVLRSGHTDRESAMAAREQLLQDRIELLGTVLNDWDPRQVSPNSRYNSYYNSYKRYQSKENA
jgi:capsular exopolysaccharide synthesis family protein